MKPILFPAGQTSFNTNGLGRLTDAISCIVTEERNGSYELHMEYPIDGQLIEEITYSRIICAVPADNKGTQPFRIYRISKPLSGIVEIDAEHISYQMAHIPIMAFSSLGLTAALQGLMNYGAESNPFTLSREGGFGAAADTNAFSVTKPDNLRSLLFGQEGSILDIFGGEWEFDKYNAILHFNRGVDNGVTIRYGKNLTDLKQEENIQNTYTGICPYWQGQDDNNSEVLVTLPEEVIHSTAAANYPFQRTKVVDFSSDFQSQPTVAQLRSKAQSYVNNNDIGSPKVSLDVSFVALHQTQEYQDLTKIEHINLCDVVTVVFPLLNVSTKAKVVKTEWDVLNDKYKSITIGEIGGRLSSSIQESENKAVERAVAQSQHAGDTTYATATALASLSTYATRVGSDALAALFIARAIAGENGGRVMIRLENPNNDEQHKLPMEMLVLVDGTVLATTQKMFRIDESGLMYSSTGYEGTWTSIIDGNGKVNAAALKGIIADAAGKNSWNLSTGAMTLDAGTTFGGKTIATLVGELMPDVSGALSTALNAYDQNLGQTAVLAKLKAGSNGTDNGFYLGEDGLLHMLTERVISGGANFPAIFLPTTIVNGAVTSYQQARVVNGVIYPPLSYTVTYYDEDGGTVLGTESVIHGHDCASVPSPDKDADSEYTYAFAGWADSVNGTVDSALTRNIVADADLYAVYTATPRG